jgi:hypothetical protein
MPTRKMGIVVDGATGRLGTTQHLKALLAMRDEGGLVLSNGDRLMPEPVLLGRDPQKLTALAARSGGLRWSTDRDSCLADPAVDIYIRRKRDRRPAGARPCGFRRRQARLSRKADRNEPRRGAVLGLRREGCRQEGRRGSGQVVPARLEETAQIVRGAVSRAGAVNTPKNL